MEKRGSPLNAISGIRKGPWTTSRPNPGRQPDGKSALEIDPELIVYYCGLIEDCAAFAYDQLPVGAGATRTSDARVCTMFATVPRAREYKELSDRDRRRYE